jgi:hypothetical protein
MAAWGKERYLLVHDTKAGRVGPRVGRVLTGPGCRYQELPLDWSAVGGESSDLESACPVEGAENQFLLAESSYYQGKYGRVFWLDASSSIQPVVTGKFLLPVLDQEIEGIATRQLDPRRWLVLLGGRGSRDGLMPGRIYWGVLEGATMEVAWTPAGLQGEEVQLPRPVGPQARTLSDMYLDQQGTLMVSACVDPGDDGPFRSLIYVGGHIRADAQSPFVRPRQASGVWWVDGCKIEALAPPPRPGYGPAYATDDEDLDGIWRAVPPHKD